MPRSPFGSVKILLLLGWSLLVHGLHAAPNILVLVSYHPGYSWSDGELQGLLRVINHTYVGAIPSVEYLDANRYPDPAYGEFIFQFLLQKYNVRKFDAVVTLDDAALQLALRHRGDFGENTPIVFGGVNNYVPGMLAGFSNVTGVCEAFDFAGNIDLILRLRPKTKTIHVISDTAPSTVATREAFQRVVPRYAGRVQFQPVMDWSGESLLQKLSTLPPDDAALIIGNARDATGQLVSENERFLRGESARSSVPIFMITQPYLPISQGYDWERAVWYGMGGRMLTADVHGEAVGSILVRILGGEKASDIPVVLVSPTRCAFHYPQLMRHHIDLARLPPDAVLFERPVSFFEQYKTRILLTLSAIALLVAAVFVLAANILKRQRAERASRVAIDRFEMVARATNDAVWDLDIATGSMWWNQGYNSLIGFAPSQPPSREAWVEALHPAERAALVAKLFDQTGTSPEPSSSETLQHRVRRVDGSVREVLLRVYFLRDASGKKIRAVGSMLDLTEHKAAERQRLMLATAVMQASEIVVLLDTNGGVEYANPAFTRATGVPLETALKQPLALFRDPNGAALSFEQIAREVSDRGRWTERLSLACSGGNPVQVQMTISAVYDASGSNSGYLAMGLDVSNEVRLEQQVRLSQKMDAIGTLAGGVAHDFNNMLQVITGNVSLALQEESTAEEIRGNLEQIQQAANRATQLTRQLLLFGRRQVPQAENVDLGLLTEDMLKLLRRLIGENYHINQTSDEGLWPVRADRGQLEQVLMNLCVNARDAMPGGGSLEISLRNVSFDATFCETHPWARLGDFTCLGVADVGCGIEPATLSRIFEPFFTTKPKDKGTGLGLSVVFGIVEQHGGFLQVESTVGKGSRFNVYLPRARLIEGDRAVPVSLETQRGSGTILVIEDEESVRTLILRVLLGAGYHVLSAGDGIEGVDLGLRHLSEISLVVLDAVLPNLSGMGVYERLAPLRPEMPFLFCSGYSADVLPEDITSLENVARLQKPFEPGKLLHEVQRQILKRAELAAAPGEAEERFPTRS